MKWLEHYLRMQSTDMEMYDLITYVIDETIENFIRLNRLSTYKVSDVVNIIKKYDYDMELNFIKEEDIQIGKKFKSEFSNNVCEIIDILNDKLILKHKDKTFSIDKNEFRKHLLKEVK